MSGRPHSPHDFGALAGAWSETADRLGLHLRPFCEVDGHPVLVAENEAARRGETGGLYLSAGVHGDECAPVWALLEWARGEPAALRGCPVTLFPCLNPAGFLENTRRDARGIDLNRSFGDPGHPVVAAWRRLLEGRRFDLAVNLHEDFDARGIYLYELTGGVPRGEDLLAACEAILPREAADEIDGTRFRNGLVVRERESIAKVVADHLGGCYPEAILLFLEYADASYTFETPSEAALECRISAHRAFLDAVSAG